MRANKKNGFTLIEVLIVVAIVGILAAIAYPSYVEQVNKMRRADAQAALVELAARLQEYYVDQSPPTYVNAPLGIVNEHYDLSFAVDPTATNFTIAVQPKVGGPMAGDLEFRLDARGARQHREHREDGTGPLINGWP